VCPELKTVPAIENTARNYLKLNVGGTDKIGKRDVKRQVLANSKRSWREGNRIYVNFTLASGWGYKSEE